MGIILKLDNDPDDIYFLEVAFDAKSVSDLIKVRLNRWGQLSNFIGNSKVYDIVAYRGVIFKNPE